MRITLVHVPLALCRERAPRGSFINIMPIGLLALADLAARRGHDVEVIHLGVERRLDPGFELSRHLRDRGSELVGLTLHWHYQLGPVAELAAALDAELPSLPLLVGGLSASAWATPLLSSLRGIDFVIRGDAELPLLALLEALETGGDLAAVPNLSYRAASAVIENEASFVAGQREIDELRFCRFERLRHAEHYNAQYGENPDGWTDPPIAYLGVGRGCTVDCAFCSGGRSGHRALAQRSGVLFRSVERVADDMNDAISRGVHSFGICFDPPGESAQYYPALFAEVRRRALRVGLVFECYRPPSSAFLADFAATFDPATSRLSFSPTVEDDELRARLLGVRYSRDVLEHTLARCRDLGIETTLYFALVPQETRRQLDRSLRWQRDVARRYGSRIVHAPIEMEPGAPWEQHPEAHGLRRPRTGFAAYLARHTRAPTLGVCYADELGYDFPDADARVVQAASALLDTRAELGEALTWSGAGAAEHVLVAPAAQLSGALGVVRGWRGRPTLVLVGTERDGPPDHDTVAKVAHVLGPQARVALYDASQVRHVRMTGPRTVPATAKVYVAHVPGKHILAAGSWCAAAGVVLACACRWCASACPALSGRWIAASASGELRCCAASPALGCDLESAAEEIRELAVELAERRGCASCPVTEHCSRCLFPSPDSEAAFCAARRELGPARLARPTAPRRTAHIGWDS